MSLLLAVAVAASWVRSYWVFDRVSCASYRCTWESFDARVQFSRWPPGMPLAASGQRWGWASDENVIPSFSYLQAVTADTTHSGHWAIRQLSLRHGALLLLLALLPAAWLIVWSRRSAR